MTDMGFAPCGKCGRHEIVELVSGSRKPDGAGGWWWQVAPGQSCLSCGEPFVELHEPAKELYPFIPEKKGGQR